MTDIRRAERIQQLTADEGVMGDISETGVALRVNNPFTGAKGSVVKIELSSKELVQVLDARVVYVKPLPNNQSQAGFEFLNMTDDKKQKIFDMVDSFSRGVPINARVVK